MVVQIIQHRGMLKEHEISKIQRYIKNHYLEMYELWIESSPNGFFN